MLADSLNKQCIACNTIGIEHDKRMREFPEQFEISEDRNQSGPGEMMSEDAYFQGTERVRFSIHGNNETVLKLKNDMIPYSVIWDSKRYERYRHILQLIGVFRNKHQEKDCMSKSTKN